MNRLLQLYDEQMRRGVPRDGRGVRVERTAHTLRFVGQGDIGWFMVGWSDLDESTADAVIADETAYFGALGHTFEWKYFDYDQPADLEDRLIAAGFKRSADESVMLGVIATMPRSAPPPGIDIVEVHDASGVDALMDVHEAVFGEKDERYRAHLLWQLENEPDTLMLVMAMDGDRAVSAARAEFPPKGEFVSLWGGATLPEYRRRGIYRALVSYRADAAAARGFHYLHVDASEDSRPILERLGFLRVARTTPYLRKP